MSFDDPSIESLPVYQDEVQDAGMLQEDIETLLIDLAAQPQILAPASPPPSPRVVRHMSDLDPTTDPDYVPPTPPRVASPPPPRAASPPPPLHHQAEPVSDSEPEREPEFSDSSDSESEEAFEDDEDETPKLSLSKYIEQLLTEPMSKATSVDPRWSAALPAAPKAHETEYAEFVRVPASLSLHDPQQLMYAHFMDVCLRSPYVPPLRRKDMLGKLLDTYVIRWVVNPSALSMNLMRLVVIGHLASLGSENDHLSVAACLARRRMVRVWACIFEELCGYMQLILEHSLPYPFTPTSVEVHRGLHSVWRVSYEENSYSSVTSSQRSGIVANRLRLWALAPGLRPVGRPKPNETQRQVMAATSQRLQLDEYCDPSNKGCGIVVTRASLDEPWRVNGLTTTPQHIRIGEVVTLAKKDSESAPARSRPNNSFRSPTPTPTRRVPPGAPVKRALFDKEPERPTTGGKHISFPTPPPKKSRSE